MKAIDSNKFWEELGRIIELPEYAVEAIIRVKVDQPVTIETIQLVPTVDNKDTKEIKKLWVLKMVESE